MISEKESKRRAKISATLKSKGGNKTTFIKGNIPWNKNKKLSENHKLSLSLALKGRKIWCEGKKLTAEHRANLSKSHTGFKHSDNQKIKISKSLKKAYSTGARVMDDKIKTKIAVAQLGPKNHMYGRFGKQNPAYKHGHTKLNKRIRTLSEYNFWRNAIFERDDYTCQMCGKRGVYLEAHHITQLQNLIEKNHIDTLTTARKCDALWSNDNGITYCSGCHILVDENRCPRGD